MSYPVHRSDGTEVPQAHSVRIYYCSGPDCDRPHVFLFDENDEPIAQFVVPDWRPGGFRDELLYGRPDDRTRQ
jgi:hypothetical protein